MQEDVYTSVHIEEYEAEARDTKLGPEEITRDVPGVACLLCQNAHTGVYCGLRLHAGTYRRCFRSQQS